MGPAAPSPVRAGLRLALHKLGRGDRAEAAGDGHPTRRTLVGPPDPKRVRRYLEVTGGAGIPALCGGAVLPPTYPALWETALLLELIRIGRLPFPVRGLLHLADERIQLRPLPAGEVLEVEAELAGIEAVGADLRLELAGRVSRRVGQACAESTSTFLLRGAGRGSQSGGRARGTEPALETEWHELTRWCLGRGHGRRYARVSGDYNPIHLWGLSARPFGFRGPVLHGYCLEALVTHALVELRCGGDPASLRRLGIRFRAPVVLPAELRLELAGVESEGGRAFRVTGSARAGRPYAEGTFVGG